ncbi:ectoine/hydroxyectoine ABC transporter permease subunit EhuC [Kaistia terrae]|jgi:polar amino acid transport system permease protein|uniref:Ectoine/hydroxyectoine ABC transporter permease subunit EhuC n=1 Tax=Kaistia terrae TaxID=537017 RepID=A0ABW0PT02_9HYPH|nr:ectoine/hydroxyectoine ABC transporter permease subunit EhuC [Kaistia terrae]MCX5578427.1 ectoine/hydroxyectoine ABC transporter permease subunit EhuC [Kaistia terrae]
MALIWEYRFDFLAGVWWTVKLSVLSALLALVLAIVAGVARSSKLRVLRIASGVYVEFFRGTSALVQLFWLFYVLPYLGIDLTPLQCATLGLGLCFGAYGAEVVRSCIQAVPQGQLDAAAALNFSYFQTLRIVILPEALIMMMPLFSNLLIELIKATSLVSLITIPDLTFQAKSIITKTYSSGNVLLVTLAIYLVISLIAASFMRRMEKVLSRGRQTGQPA